MTASYSLKPETGVDVECAAFAGSVEWAVWSSPNLAMAARVVRVVTCGVEATAGGSAAPDRRQRMAILARTLPGAAVGGFFVAYLVGIVVVRVTHRNVAYNPASDMNGFSQFVTLLVTLCLVTPAALAAIWIWASRRRGFDNHVVLGALLAILSFPLAATVMALAYSSGANNGIRVVSVPAMLLSGAAYVAWVSSVASDRNRIRASIITAAGVLGLFAVAIVGPINEDNHAENQERAALTRDSADLATLGGTGPWQLHAIHSYAYRRGRIFSAPLLEVIHEDGTFAEVEFPVPDSRERRCVIVAGPCDAELTLDDGTQLNVTGSSSGQVIFEVIGPPAWRIESRTITSEQVAELIAQLEPATIDQWLAEVSRHHQASG